MSEFLENKLLLLFHALKRLGVSTVATRAMQTHHSDVSSYEKVSSLTQLCEKALMSWEGVSIRQLDEHWMKTRLAFQMVQDETIARSLLWNTQSEEDVKSQATILLTTLENIRISPLYLAHHQALEDIKSNLKDYALLSKVDVKDELAFFDDLIVRSQQRYFLATKLNSFSSRIHGEDQSFIRFKKLSKEEKEKLVTEGHSSDPYCIKNTLQYAQEFGHLPKKCVLLGAPTRDPVFPTMDELSQMVNRLSKDTVRQTEPELSYLHDVHPINKSSFLKRLFGKKEDPSSLPSKKVMI